VDVHPPHQPIHTWRDFFIHLITITIGLLIALSLEGLVEMVHHHNLVNEARADLRSEMMSNHTRVAGNLAEVRADEARIGDDIKMLRAIQAGRKLKSSSSLTYAFRWNSLGNSAWKTAASSGALIYLDFESARDMAEVYSMQDDLVSSTALRLQRDHLLASAPILVQDDPTKSTKEALQLSLQRSADLFMDLKTLEQLLVELDQQYTQELAKL